MPEVVPAIEHLRVAVRSVAPDQAIKPSDVGSLPWSPREKDHPIPEILHGVTVEIESQPEIVDG